MKVKEEVIRALWDILDGLEGVGCFLGFGSNCTLIFVGQSERGKVWALISRPGSSLNIILNPIWVWLLR